MILLRASMVCYAHRGLRERENAVGLPRKNRGIRLGAPEVAAFALLVTTLSVGALCLVARPAHGWPRTMARVTGVTIPRGSDGARHPGDARINFEYSARGGHYRGEADHAAVRYVLYQVMPENIRERLVSRGTLEVHEIAPEHLEELSAGGLLGQLYLPENWDEQANALWASAPQHVRAAIDRGDTTTTLAYLNEHRSQGKTMSIPLVQMSVAYNPARPYEYRVRYLGIDTYPWLMSAFFGCVLLTLAYTGVLYPRLRR